LFRKKFDFFSAVIFIFIFGHQNPGSGLDPDRYSAQNAGSGSVSNEYGSETLEKRKSKETMTFVGDFLPTAG
jgi:hypothetical protein